MRKSISYGSGYAKSRGMAQFPGLFDGLVGAWVPALGGTGQNIFDIVSGSGTALTGSPTWGVKDGHGAILFDGSDDECTIANPFLKGNNNPFSLSAWIWPNASITYGRVFEKGINNEWVLDFEDGVSLVLNMSTVFVLDTGIDDSDARWRHLVITYSNPSAICYTDGTQQATGSRAIAAGTNSFYIGRYGGGSYHGSFHLGSVALYDRVVSATEARLLYSLGPAGWLAPKKFSISSDQSPPPAAQNNAPFWLAAISQGI